MFTLKSRASGFTIVELLIVIVVIAILAAITVVAYNGIQNRAKDSTLASQMNGIVKRIEQYGATNGSYPSTGGTNTPRTDSNCPVGSVHTDWVPGLTDLPQSDLNHRGVSNYRGCFIYASDGTSYIISAWNMLKEARNSTFYKRMGYRGMAQSNQYYLCNNVNVGGMTSGTYDLKDDYYKFSYTATNISGCNETPPAGA